MLAATEARVSSCPISKTNGPLVNLNPVFPMSQSLIISLQAMRHPWPPPSCSQPSPTSLLLIHTSHPPPSLFTSSIQLFRAIKIHFFYFSFAAQVYCCKKTQSSHTERLHPHPINVCCRSVIPNLPYWSDIRFQLTQQCVLKEKLKTTGPRSVVGGWFNQRVEGLK